MDEETAMTDPDPWIETRAEYRALVSELADTLDLDAGLADALRQAGLKDGEDESRSSG